MQEPLVPKLRKITVRYDRLVLDPNNPRFITRKEDRVPEEDYLEQDIAQITSGKLYTPDKDHYKIAELINSIKQNGWLPVDYVFVRKLAGHEGYYTVLEGNRRVLAIRQLMNDKDTEPALKKSLQSIEVMELIDKGSPEEVQKKISYILGVRHHGSLKKWTPFAQADNILNRYLEVARQTPDNFEWNEDYGQEVANMLSIQDKEVEARLRVYRVMSQVGTSPAVKDSSGGMKDRYYSICAEPLLSPRKKLEDYVNQDPKTFLLNELGVTRMNKLCHFDQPNRDKAPLHNPEEWRYLDKILADEDLEKRDANLKRVEDDKEHPSDVWAERAAEIFKPTWSKWLSEVDLILKRVTLGDDFVSEKAIQTAKRLCELIEKLDERDVH